MAPRLLRFRLFSLGVFLIALSAIAARGQTIDFTSSPYPSGSSVSPATLGVAYIYDADAAASDGSEVRYSLRFGPSGMTVDARTGVVSWQPTGEGEFDAEIRAELADNPAINTTQGWRISASQTLTHPGCTGNEVWITVGTGLPDAAYHAAVVDDLLYVMHRSGPQWNTTRLSAWNGSYWSTVTDMDSRIIDSTIQLISCNGDLYLGTQMGDLPGTTGTAAIARWDGTAWSGVGTPPFSGVIDMAVLGNDLYVLGWRSDNMTWSQILAKWDGTAWETLYDAAATQWPDWGVALAPLNGKMYAAARPGAMGLDWNDIPLFEVEGNTLVPVENREMNFVNDYRTIDLIPHNGTLVLVTEYKLLQWDGTGTEAIDVPPSKGFGQRSTISYNNELYVGTWMTEGALPMIVNYEIWRLGSDSWRPVSSIQALLSDNPWNAILNFVEYDGDLYGYGLLYQSCGAALNNVTMLGTENNVARVSGTVYHDDDRDCTFDSGEPVLPGEIIEILPGPFYTITNASGEYSTWLRPGGYTLTVKPRLNWTDACPVPAAVTLASPADVADNVNLGADMIPGIYDVRSSLAVGRPRPGFDFTYTLSYWNSGTEPATGKLIFEYDNRLTFLSADQASDRHSGNVVEWDFADLPVGGSVSITVTMNVPASMPINTELCALLDVELEQKDDDEFLNDNRDEVCVIVTGSYDPNDIRVAPVRYDEELGEAPLLPGDTVLSYMVRFQNTGTDTAFTVTVADTLDAALLDVASIRLGAASHDYEFDISGSGILTWTFRNIMLPDSGANELASHGYFKYSIRLRRGLAPMTAIPNRAAIYFDYNAPVITNTVVSVTSGTLSAGEEDARTSALQLYPNPLRGAGMIRLTLPEREHVTLRLTDGRGSVITVFNRGELNAGEHNFRLDTEGLASGAYYLLLEKGGEKEIYPVVVSR